jgi:hypothetical protein
MYINYISITMRHKHVPKAANICYIKAVHGIQDAWQFKKPEGRRCLGRFKGTWEDNN